MIRRATFSDIEAILSITNACAKFMINNGIYQWNEHYPNAVAFKKDIERNELFVLTNSEKIIGCIVISDLMDDEYRTVDWNSPNGKNIYIHRLAVHPDYQGQGFAQEMMDFAEMRARSENYVSVRLDTFSENKRNQKFYQQRGYQKLGAIYFLKQSEAPFYCYELIL